MQWITQVLVLLRHGLFWVDMPSLRQMLSMVSVIIMDYQWIYNILIIGVNFFCLLLWWIIKAQKKKYFFVFAAVMDVKDIPRQKRKDEKKILNFIEAKNWSFLPFTASLSTNNTKRHCWECQETINIIFFLLCFHRWLFIVKEERKNKNHVVIIGALIKDLKTIELYWNKMK